MFNDEENFPTEETKFEILEYLLQNRRILKRRATTDCITKKFLSENNQLIYHDPLTYITNNRLFPSLRREDNFALLAAKCRASNILSNAEATLVDISLDLSDENRMSMDNTSGNDVKREFNDTLEEVDFMLSNNITENVTRSQQKQSKIPIKKADIQFQKLKALEQTRTSPRFKVPTNTVAKTILSKRLNYKHIMSPVAVLIHKTPSSPLIKHAKLSQNTLNLNKRYITTPKKDDMLAMPNVTCKISNYKHVLDGENVHLPHNIQKLVGTPVQIIKHIENDEVKSIVDETLMDGDLTIKARMLDDSENGISIVSGNKKY